jgi:hypothetical protein
MRASGRAFFTGLVKKMAKREIVKRKLKSALNGDKVVKGGNGIIIIYFMNCNSK